MTYIYSEEYSIKVYVVGDQPMMEVTINDDEDNPDAAQDQGQNYIHVEHHL